MHQLHSKAILSSLARAKGEECACKACRGSGSREYRENLSGSSFNSVYRILGLVPLPRSLCRCLPRSKRAWEVRRLQMNFIFLLFLDVVGSVGWSSSLNSLHQFVVDPPSDICMNNCSQSANITADIPAGLGQSELLYSWAVAIYYFGEVAGAVIMGILVRHLPFWYALLIGLPTSPLGYFLYLTATTGQALLLSRLLIGTMAGIVPTIAYSYFGENAEHYSNICETGKDKRTKEWLIGTFTLVGAAASMIGPIMSAVLAQVPDLDRLRSIGWVNVVLGLFSIIGLFLIFHGETKSCWSRTCHWHGSCTVSCPFSTRSLTRKLAGTSVDSNSIKSGFWKLVVSLYKIIASFFLMAYYVLSSGFAVVDTVTMPILQDSFGFSIKEASYFFLGVTFVYLLGSLLVLILTQLLRANNRTILIFGLVLSLVGCIVLADWHSIGIDPCQRFSMNRHAPVAVLDPEPTLHSISSEEIQIPRPREEGKRFVGISPEMASEMNNYALPWITACLGHDTGEYRCYWNQHSRVTGNICHECLPICRSEQRSLHFTQFCVGMFLFVLAIPVTRTVLVVLASDAFGSNTGSHGILMGFLIAMEGLARVLTPIWVDYSYEASGKRTFVVMTGYAFKFLVVLFGAVLTYSRLPHGTLVLQDEEKGKEDCSETDTASASDSDLAEQDIMLPNMYRAPTPTGTN